MLDRGLEDIAGVGTSLASRLRTAGYPTIESIAVTPPREVKERTGIALDTIVNIQEAARKMISVGFTTAQELYEKRKTMRKCTTGSKKLDEVLNEGIETRALTEFIGEFGSGKTQVCLMLSVPAQLPAEQGRFGGNVSFIDTEGTFMPERVYQIASETGLDPADAASNILLARANPNKPAGGNVIAHACAHRIFLRKGSKGARIATVIAS